MNRVPPREMDAGFREWFKQRRTARHKPVAPENPDVSSEPVEPAEPAACASQAEVDELKMRVDDLQDGYASLQVADPRDVEELKFLLKDMREKYETLRVDFMRFHAFTTWYPRDQKEIWDELRRLRYGGSAEDDWRELHGKQNTRKKSATPKVTPEIASSSDSDE